MTKPSVIQALAGSDRFVVATTWNEAPGLLAKLNRNAPLARMVAPVRVIPAELMTSVLV